MIQSVFRAHFFQMQKPRVILVSIAGELRQDFLRYPVVEGDKFARPVIFQFFLKELLARGRYALFKSPEKWTDSQRQRVDLMFSLYPDLKKPTGCHNISVQYSPTRSQWPTMPDSIWLVGTTVSPNQDSSHSTQSRQHFTNTPMK